jgi:hypothetical protein
MKHIVFFAVIAFAAPAWSQDKPAAKEPAKEAAKPKQAEKQAAAGAPRIPNPRRWKEDARHCLERPTTSEIIKCAEEYL